LPADRPYDRDPRFQAPGPAPRPRSLPARTARHAAGETEAMAAPADSASPECPAAPSMPTDPDFLSCVLQPPAPSSSRPDADYAALRRLLLRRKPPSALQHRMVRRHPLLSAPPRSWIPSLVSHLALGNGRIEFIGGRGLLLLRAGLALQRQGLRRLPQLPPPAHRRR